MSMESETVSGMVIDRQQAADALSDIDDVVRRVRNRGSTISPACS
jgi:hypothetical protein